MRIGIFAFTGDSKALEAGGTTYNRVLLKGLIKYGPSHEYIVFLSEINSRRYDDINAKNLHKIILPASYFKKVSSKIAKVFRVLYLLFHGKNVNSIAFDGLKKGLIPQISELYSQHIDIVHYTSRGIALQLAIFNRLPYIITINDLRHLYLHPYSKRNLVSRFFTKYLLANAQKIIIPSEQIREDIVNVYKVKRDKVFKLFSPPDIDSMLSEKSTNIEDVISKYQLPKKFLFFPSTFVETKNHLGLLDAILLLKEKHNLSVNLVLSGSKGNENLFNKIMRKIKDNDLKSNVLYLGFVPVEDMKALYRAATALIMPEYFASLSLPIWEAFVSGCPVVSSNSYDLPEQLGDAALSFNPMNCDKMAEEIYKIYKNENLRNELIKRGFKRAKLLSIENYAKQMINIYESCRKTI